MVYSLDYNDYYIFFELLADPFTSTNKISEALGLAPGTVRDRISSMKSSGFLRPDRQILDQVLQPHDTLYNGERTETEIVGTYLPSALGLSRQHVYLEGFNSKTELDAFNRFCDEHPYTHYRSTYFGNGKGVYAQFDVPPVIESKMESIYTNLKSELNLVKVEISTEEIQLRTTFDYETWLSAPRDWNSSDNLFSQEDSSLFSLWHEFLDENIDVKNQSEPEKVKFDNLDASLIRELTINAKSKVKFLSEVYGRDKSVISRHLTKLKKHVVTRANLRYDFQTFGFNNYHLINGKFKDKATRDNFEKFISYQPLPLVANISFDDLKYNIFSVSSPGIASGFMSILWDISDPQSLRVMNSMPNSFYTYFFFNGNYEENTGWKTDQNYIEDSAMAEIKI